MITFYIPLINNTSYCYEKFCYLIVINYCILFPNKYF